MSADIRLAQQAKDAVNSADLLVIAVDGLLTKLEGCLNSWARIRVKSRIKNLEREVAKLELSLDVLRDKSSALAEEIDEARDRLGSMSFGFRDFLVFFGLAYLAKRLYRKAVLEQLQGAQEHIEHKMGSIRKRVDKIQRKAERLRQRAESEHPSLLARIIRFLRRLVGVLSTLMSVIEGRIVAGFASLGLLIRSCLSEDTAVDSSTD